MLPVTSDIYKPWVELL